jgi:NIPSNAP
MAAAAGVQQHRPLTAEGRLSSVSHRTDPGDTHKERRMKTFWCMLAVVVLAGAAALPAAAAEKEKDVKKADTRYFELRTYYAASGKMDALNTRFKDHTNKLFKKHGMDIVGFWTDVNKPDVLVYILAYPSKEAREKSWKAFREDPDWIKAKEESEKDGKLVDKVEEKYLTPTDYSPIK